eukprot:snap_masked-scaffold_1-processed-gene-13.21-mRNA-1 protein AED:1.00 eAED:1.00 QI:0/-1/0/0/-1/1/1/0/513
MEILYEKKNQVAFYQTYLNSLKKDVGDTKDTEIHRLTLTKPRTEERNEERMEDWGDICEAEAETCLKKLFKNLDIANEKIIENSLERLSKFIKLRELPSDNALMLEMFLFKFKAMLKLFTHKKENIKLIVVEVFVQLLAKNEFVDIDIIFPYMFPIICEKLSVGYQLDFKHKRFYLPMHSDTNEILNRGGAIDPHDFTKVKLKSTKENSEEVRLILLQLMNTAIDRSASMKKLGLLAHHLHTIIICLISEISGRARNSVENRVLALEVLTNFLKIKNYGQALAPYCQALTTSLVEILSSKKSKERVACLRCLGFCVREIESVYELIGFREDNVIPVYVYYQREIRHNHLGKLLRDHNEQVRMEIAIMLENIFFFTYKGFDFVYRLVPFVLTLLVDDCEEVQKKGYKLIDRIGGEEEMNRHWYALIPTVVKEIKEKIPKADILLSKIFDLTKEPDLLPHVDLIGTTLVCRRNEKLMKKFVSKFNSTTYEGMINNWKKCGFNKEQLAWLRKFQHG